MWRSLKIQLRKSSRPHTEISLMKLLKSRRNYSKLNWFYVYCLNTQAQNKVENALIDQITKSLLNCVVVMNSFCFFLFRSTYHVPTLTMGPVFKDAFIQSRQQSYKIGTNYFLFTEDNTKVKRDYVTSLGQSMRSGDRTVGSQAVW